MKINLVIELPETLYGEFLQMVQLFTSLTPMPQNAYVVEQGENGELKATMVAHITCPVCNRTTYNPNDILHGYCGNCHAYTGKPDAQTQQ